MDDCEIINLFFDRSEQAIEELGNKYGRVCKRVALNILSNGQDADECVNDAYLGVWNSIPPQKPSPLLTYLCRIVRNLSIKKYHANTAQKRNSFYDVALSELEECIPAQGSVADEMDAKELGQLLDVFLGTLDGKSRVLFMRRYFFSEPLPNLAEEFGITAHNAAVRLSRTRARLAKFLISEGVSL